MNFYPLTKRALKSRRRPLNQLFRIMKLTAFIITIAILQVSARVAAQKVTLNEQQVSLEKVFKDIRLQTGYDFLIDNGLVEKAGPVTINVKNADLKDVLDVILQSPLAYEVVNKTVVVKNQQPSLFENLKDKAAKLLALPADVHGKVIDSLGQPIIGANVILSIKGYSYGTVTDNKGEFQLNKLPQERYTLVITYVGYDKLEKVVDLNGSDLSLNLVLHNSSSVLDQIQVIAYGTESKRFNVGSVTTVTAEDIEKQPVSNPLLALQGQVAGLNITATSGIPGSQVLVQVRGQNSLNVFPNLNNTIANPTKPYDQPLFIVDGVPFAAQNNNVNQLASLVTAQTYTGGVNNGAQVGISPFNNIDPADIESITVLKDADATSIYGTQGANGVILITTKKGKAGPTNFDLTVNTGFNSASHPVQMLNTQQYVQLRENALAADGLTPNSNPNDYTGAYAPDLTIFDQNKYTNWEKAIYGQNTSNTDVHGSLSGGTANNTFIISTGYDKSTYDYPGDFADQRYTLHSSLHHGSTDNRFSVDLTTDFGYDQNNSSGFDGGSDVVLPPNLPNLLGPSGNLIWNYKGVDLTTDQFYAGLQEPTYLQNYNFNTAFHISYKLLEGLTISANMGYNRNSTNENSQMPAAAQNPAGFVLRQSNFGVTTFQTVNIEPQINYTKKIGRGIFSALVGGTYKKNVSNSTQVDASGYSSDFLLNSVNDAPQTSVYNMDTYDIYRYSAGFARLNYIYNSEFILNLTGRRDGSSNFGPTHQFGDFGSAGAGWIFTEEKAVAKALPFMSFGKLSGSYGTSGTDGAYAYQFLSLYKTIQYFPAFQGISPTSPFNLYNPDYSWAVKKSLNVALDLGFFNNRVLLNATYYRDREGNQLVQSPLPIQVGLPAVLENLNATVQNKGYEFTINTTNIQTKNFSWKTNFNLTFNRNKLIAFPNLANSTYANTYVIGQPTTIVYGFKYKDVNPTTGLFEFYKADGKTVTSNPAYGLPSAGGDEVPIADQQVKYMGGFGNNFTYKQFSLYIFCQFADQNAQNYLAQVYTSYQLGFEYNEPEAVLGNYWEKPGDVAQLQRLASGYSSSAINTALKFGQSSGIYSNDTYLRVKTVSFSYQLPNTFLNKVYIKGASVFVNAQNLFTFTNYKAGDPETPGLFTGLPVQRILAFGLNLKF